MAAMATPNGGVCPESQAIQKKLSVVVDRITTSASPLWLSQKLKEEGFISSQRAAGILNTMGISSSEKVSFMMEAVESRIKSDSKPSQPFGKFIEVLQSEPSLQDVVRILDACYQDILDSARDDSESDDRAPLLTTSERNQEICLNEAASSHQIHARHDSEHGQPRNNDSAQNIQSSKQKGSSLIQFTSVWCCYALCILILAIAILTIFDKNDFHSMIDFLWLALPSAVMFGLSISACTLEKSGLWTRLRILNIIAVCWYSASIIFFLWKQLGSSSVRDVYLLNSDFIFISAAIIALPYNTCLKVTAIVTVIICTTTSLGFIIFAVAATFTAPANEGDSNYIEAFSIGVAVAFAILVEMFSLSETLHLLRITNTKRYVLFNIILLLYMGYCTSGIVRGLVTVEDIVLTAAGNIYMSFMCLIMREELRLF